MSAKYITKEVCDAKYTALKEDVQDIKEDVKSIKINHLPHIQESINKLDKKQSKHTIYIGIAITIITMLCPLLIEYIKILLFGGG